MKQIKTYFTVFLIWTMVGVFSKLLFMACYEGMFASVADIIWHGLRLDFAIAGYLTLIPCLLLIVGLWYIRKPLLYFWNIYMLIMSIAYITAIIANIALYKYWGFPFDNTPLLYITTSPADAAASMSTWQMIVFPLMAVIVTVILFLIFIRFTKPYHYKNMLVGKKVTYSLLLLLLGAMLIIPIRGGFGTGTNHTGSVYFTNDAKKNHAAVNPLFSFFESITHDKENFASAYRFMTQQQADSIFTQMKCTRLRNNVSASKPNVIIICLEGFSSYIMSESGHVKDVTPNLDTIANNGLYFTRFYANSFRTDRGLVSVLSGMPAQPTMSIMDLPRKSTQLPSIANSLASHGYDTHFYYGGDVDFSNMRSYLLGTGFEHITSDEQFSKKELTGKWGAPDGTVYKRLLDDIRKVDNRKPFFKFMMTLSSHEPYDVPYKSKLSPDLNAFAYADKCLGNFIHLLRTTESWKNTLVLIVPDHLGVYPPKIDNYSLWRYEIPLIMTGGIVNTPERNNTIGSQNDIAATLLAMLGISHEDFPFSKDLLDDTVPHFAFFTFPNAMGLVTDDGCIIYDNNSNSTYLKQGEDTDSLTVMAKAYLQKLYDYLASLP